MPSSQAVSHTFGFAYVFLLLSFKVEWISTRISYIFLACSLVNSGFIRQKKEGEHILTRLRGTNIPDQQNKQRPPQTGERPAYNPRWSKNC